MYVYMLCISNNLVMAHDATSHDSPMAEAVASNEVTAAEIEEVSPSSTDFNGDES